MHLKLKKYHLFSKKIDFNHIYIYLKNSSKLAVLLNTTTYLFYFFNSKLIYFSLFLMNASEKQANIASLFSKLKSRIIVPLVIYENNLSSLNNILPCNIQSKL